MFSVSGAQGGIWTISHRGMFPDPPSPSPGAPRTGTDVADGGVVPEAHTEVPLGATAHKRSHGGLPEGRLGDPFVPLGAELRKSDTDWYNLLVWQMTLSCIA